VTLIGLLNETVLWWHWIVFGIILLIIEISTGTFFILGLGIAAILVGIFDVFFQTSFTLELSIWMILSVLTIMSWLKWFKEPTVSETGQSNYNLNTLGTVIHEIKPHKRGKVTFDTPILGNTTWTATSNTNIAKNTRVKIVEVHGQLIEVTPIKN